MTIRSKYMEKNLPGTVGLDVRGINITGNNSVFAAMINQFPSHIENTEIQFEGERIELNTTDHTIGGINVLACPIHESLVCTICRWNCKNIILKTSNGTNDIIEKWTIDLLHLHKPKQLPGSFGEVNPEPITSRQLPSNITIYSASEDKLYIREKDELKEIKEEKELKHIVGNTGPIAGPDHNVEYFNKLHYTQPTGPQGGPNGDTSEFNPYLAVLTGAQGTNKVSFINYGTTGPNSPSARTVPTVKGVNGAEGPKIIIHQKCKYCHRYHA